MKMRKGLLLACGILGMCVIACSEVVDDPAPADDLTEVDVATGEPQEVGAVEGVEARSTASAVDEAATFAATCKQSCTSVYNSTGASCGPFYGYGRTTVFGSCQKACNRAYDHAAQQAAAIDCRLIHCTSSSC